MFRRKLRNRQFKGQIEDKNYWENISTIRYNIITDQVILSEKSTWETRDTAKDYHLNGIILVRSLSGKGKMSFSCSPDKILILKFDEPVSVRKEGEALLVMVD